jgi:hypothetical protein
VRGRWIGLDARSPALLSCSFFNAFDLEVTMIKKTLGAALFLVLAGCGGTEATGGTAGTAGAAGTAGSAGSAGASACGPEQSGCLEFSHTFDVHKLEPGFESDTGCESWTLNNAEELFVSSVDFKQTTGYHHSNWYFVPNTMFDLPDGSWDCNEQKLDGLAVAVAGGVLYGQSIDIEDEGMHFPEGVAIRIPPYSRVIGVTHLLNVTSKDIEANATLKVKAIPKAEVKTQLVPFRMIYHDLHVPPHAKSNFRTDCDFQTAQGGKPFNATLYYMQVHYHQMGTAGKLWTYGGPDDGKLLTQYEGIPAGEVLSPPLVIKDAKGLSWDCSYNNTGSTELVWADDDYLQEMCFWFGFIDGETAFAAQVGDGDNMVDGMDGDVVLNSGYCAVAAVPWKDKPGGEPPK